jgi:sigma-E factor negative regulatory protein RseA
MNEELDSQLSAMFDGELPQAQCELLARRLSRDEQLKARWGRYAVIGASIRAESGVRLSADLARRVNAAVCKEPNIAVRFVERPAAQAAARWIRPVAGLGVAAGVAALSILWMRSQNVSEMYVSTQSAVPPADTSAQALRTADPNSSYVVPRPSPQRSVVPATQLANYVVAHSEFSSPVTRRNLLSALMTGESGTAGTSNGSEEGSEDVYDDAKNTAQ